MTRTVVCAGEGATFKELVRLMHEHRVSAVPVLDAQGRAVGVVSEGDLLLKEDLPFQEEVRFFENRELRTERRKAGGQLARELMTSPAIVVGPEAGLSDAASLMHAHRVHRLPVVDERDRVIGIVSRVDLLGVYLRADDDLAQEVTATLVDELLLEPDAIAVTAREGVVSLEGTVQFRSSVGEIAKRVRAVDGVVGLDVRLEWEIDDASVPLGPVPWVGF